MSSWLSENSLKWYQKFAVNVIKCGPVPKHIAIIMDGNRRYAKKNNVQISTGHSKGFDKLTEIIYWCSELNLYELTIYAFSIENFKRKPEEVETLFNLLRTQMRKLIEEKDKLRKKGIGIRIIGNIALMPADIRKLLAEAVLATKDNTKIFLNIAIAYTSRDEITKSIESIISGVKNGDINSDDVNSDLITSCMYSRKLSKVDIIIRPSGETRFSDFMLWQIWNTNIVFTQVLWPDFSIWDLLYAVFLYQRNYGDVKKIDKKLRYDHGEKCDRVVKFLDKFEEDNLKQLKAYT